MASPTLDRVLDAIIRVDTGFNIKFVSEVGLDWLRAAGYDVAPASFIDLLHPDDIEAFRAAAEGVPDYFGCDIRVLRQGAERWINVRGFLLPDANQYVMCIIDISPWKANDSAFKHAAEHDDLTGLPNRAFLKREVDSYIQAGNRPFSLALLDLDGFKKVNDTLGHVIGDAVLIETSKRLNKVMAEKGICARLGGDEFVLILPGQDAVGACKTMEAILFSIARPFDTAPHNAYLGVSIGLAEFPTHGDSYSMLLKNADTAMYQSKNAGKNRVSIFTQSNVSADFSLKAAIHDGIQNGEFYLDYQPQFDMNRNIVGAEALMRWNSKSLGRVSPDQFIPLVEEAGLMPFLGKWALRYSCHQLKKFQTLNPHFVMSVNVSPIQFGAEDFDDAVLEAIAEADVDPTRVILEITESTLMHSQERTEKALARLREKGIRFSIDDFGTGFSSLAYLTRLPVSSIKIDKAFVRAMEDTKRDFSSDKKLITAMINLARSIDLKVVAEGVESETQFAFLKESGCDLIQGYLLGKPLSAATMTNLLDPQSRVAS